MAQNVFVVFESLIDSGWSRKLNEGFSVGTSISVANRQMNTFLTLNHFTIFKEIQNFRTKNSNKIIQDKIRKGKCLLTLWYSKASRATWWYFFLHSC